MWIGYERYIANKRFLKYIILDKEISLRASIVLSHDSVVEIKEISQLLFMTDDGFIIDPIWEKKFLLIENAVKVARACGIGNPKVAILWAIEFANTKMKWIINAIELAKLDKKGEIKNCIVDGPISLDINKSREVWEIKNL